MDDSSGARDIDAAEADAVGDIRMSHADVQSEATQSTSAYDDADWETLDDSRNSDAIEGGVVRCPTIPGRSVSHDMESVCSVIIREGTSNVGGEFSVESAAEDGGSASVDYLPDSRRLKGLRPNAKNGSFVDALEGSRSVNERSLDGARGSPLVLSLEASRRSVESDGTKDASSAYADEDWESLEEPSSNRAEGEGGAGEVGETHGVRS